MDLDGPAIDWAATGQMLAGMGTMLGALAVAFGAWFGARQWRTQQISRQNMDMAAEILAKVYRMEIELKELMQRTISDDEVAKLGLELDPDISKHNIDYLDKGDLQRLIDHRYLNPRFEDLDFEAIKISARLHFGQRALDLCDEIEGIYLDVGAIGYDGEFTQPTDVDKEILSEDIEEFLSRCWFRKCVCKRPLTRRAD